MAAENNLCGHRFEGGGETMTIANQAARDAGQLAEYLAGGYFS